MAIYRPQVGAVTPSYIFIQSIMSLINEDKYKTCRVSWQSTNLLAFSKMDPIPETEPLQVLVGNRRFYIGNMEVIDIPKSFLSFKPSNKGIIGDGVKLPLKFFNCIQYDGSMLPHIDYIF